MIEKTRSGPEPAGAVVASESFTGPSSHDCTSGTEGASDSVTWTRVGDDGAG